MGRIWFVVPIILTATAWLYFLTTIAPRITADIDKNLKFPSTFNELKSIAELLNHYYKENWIYMIVLFSSAYLYKQTFIIPGSVFMNVLAGALFGITIGFPLCCFLTAIGASSCYLLSRTFGKDTLHHYFPNQIEYLRCKVRENSNQLVYFLLFLRLFPMTPNWLINLLSPIVGVPLHLFFLTVFMGLMPYNFLCVQAGVILTTLTSIEEVVSLKSFLQLAFMALVALGPSFFLRKSKLKLSPQTVRKSFK